MNKIQEAMQTMQDMSDVINMQAQEIEELRGMLFRAYIKNGSYVFGGTFSFSPTESFTIEGKREESETGVMIIDPKLKIVDYAALGMTSRYMEILAKIEQLKK